MLWSLLKIVLFVAIVGGLAYGGQLLLGMEGGVQITVAGTEITLTAFNSVIAALVLMLVLWITLKLASLLVAILRFINGDETAISRYFDRNRERKGFAALSEGMMALASGEGKLAMAKAAKAETYLRKPELTNLLTAQAAEMAGERRKAEATYKKLIADERTRFVGVRGIMKQKLAAGDTDTALKLAERAFAIKPRHVEVQDTLLQLQAQKEDWTGARKTLNAKLKHGAIPRDLHRRRDAVLALSEATSVLDEDAGIKAQEAAIQANKLSGDLVPAAAMAARSYIAKGKGRNATRVLKKAWSVQPHPDLAAAFAEIEPDETPAARLRRFQTLFALVPDHRETKLVRAELNIAAEDFPNARRALGDLAESDPDARVLTILAAIERGEGASDAVVRGWLARAVTAPRGPQWVCENCSNIEAEWRATCSNCGGFDTLSWTTPKTSDNAMQAGAAMLPLIVGAIEDRSEEAAAAPAAEAAAATVDEAEIVEPETSADAAPEADAQAEAQPSEEPRKAS
jgi:HemY protein